MELASMLAGEKFSDRPHAVSPVLGRFLRCYNDRLDDERRQDLYPIASRVVGTAAPGPVERSRLLRCVQWIAESGQRVPLTLRIRAGLSAATLAGKLAAEDFSEDGRKRALALIDELIALGDSWAGIPSDPGELGRPTVRLGGS
jgi:hypothetical protein